MSDKSAGQIIGELQKISSYWRVQAEESRGKSDDLQNRIDELTMPEEVKAALIYSVNYTISECVTNRRFIEALEWLGRYK